MMLSWAILPSKKNPTRLPRTVAFLKLFFLPTPDTAITKNNQSRSHFCPSNRYQFLHHQPDCTVFSRVTKKTTSKMSLTDTVNAAATLWWFVFLSKCSLRVFPIGPHPLPIQSHPFHRVSSINLLRPVASIALDSQCLPVKVKASNIYSKDEVKLTSS